MREVYRALVLGCLCTVFQALAGEPVKQRNGTLLDKHGQPLAYATINLPNGSQTQTDEAGHFSLNTMNPPSRLQITTRDGRKATVAYPKDEVPIHVTLTGKTGEQLIAAPGTREIQFTGKGNGGAWYDESQARATPQVVEDPLRLLGQLPGVTSHDGTAKFATQGGGPDETLYQLNGMDIVDPFNRRDNDYFGSIVNPSTLQRLTLTPGGADAAHGETLGSVVTMETTREKMGQVSLDIYQATAQMGGAMAQGRGNYLVSLRRHSADALQNWDEDDEDDQTFNDLFLNLGYELGTNHYLQANFLRGEEEQPAYRSGRQQNADRKNYLWFGLDSRWGEQLSSKSLVYAGHTNEREERESLDIIDGPYVHSQKYLYYGLKQTWLWQQPSGNAWQAGFDWRQHRAEDRYFDDVLLQQSEGETNYERRDERLTVSDNSLALWLTRVQQIGETATLSMGMRYEKRDWTDHQAISPRLNLEWRANEHTTWRAAAGRYYRNHGLGQLYLPENVTAYHPEIRNDQLSLGVTYQVEGGPRLEAEGWYRDYHHLSAATSEEVGYFPALGLHSADEQTYGVTLALAGSWWDRLAYRASYTHSRDLHGADWGDAGPIGGRHRAKLQLGWQISRRWRTDLAWTYNEGHLAADQPTIGAGLLTSDQLIELEPNNILSLKLTRDFDIGRNRGFSFYIEAFNIFEDQNIVGRNYFPTSNGQLGYYDEESIGPGANLGLKFRF